MKKIDKKRGENAYEIASIAKDEGQSMMISQFVNLE